MWKTINVNGIGRDDAQRMAKYRLNRFAREEISQDDRHGASMRDPQVHGELGRGGASGRCCLIDRQSDQFSIVRDKLRRASDEDVRPTDVADVVLPPLIRWFASTPFVSQSEPQRWIFQAPDSCVDTTRRYP